MTNTTTQSLDWLRTLVNCCEFEEESKPNSVSLFILHTKFRPCEIKYHFEKNGTQYVFRFKNNYGASVVSHDFSYALELALIKWDENDSNDDFKLVYNQDFPDVQGNLDDAQVGKLLTKIKKLT